MTGKRDEVFLLGEEVIGADPWSAPEEEPTATAPVPGLSRPGRLRAGWPLILGALVPVVVVAFLARPGGDAADPAPPRPEVPAVLSTPEVEPVARTPREADRPHRAPESRLRRRRPGDRRTAAEGELPAPLAEAASAPVVTYTPAPEATPEPALKDAAAVPAPAAPLPTARPEFGIER
jgi:hypothetical protein